MDPQSKRTLVATLVCIAVLMLWFRIQAVLYPPPAPMPPDPAATQPAAVAGTDQPAEPDAGQPASTQRAVSAAPTSPVTTPPMAAAAFHVEDAAETEPVTIGSAVEPDPRRGVANPFELQAVIMPRGAGVASIRLARFRNELPKNRRDPEPDPYDLLSVVTDGRAGSSRASLTTERVRLMDAPDKPEIDLGAVVWRVGDRRVDNDGESVNLQTVVKQGERNVLLLEKTYRIRKGSHHLEVGLTVENLGSDAHRVLITQAGPIGMKHDEGAGGYGTAPSRRVVSAVVDDAGRYHDGMTATQDEVKKAAGHTFDLKSSKGRTAWAALNSKYFTCILVPLPPQRPDGKPAAYADYLGKASGVFVPGEQPESGDLSLELVLAPAQPVGPGGKQSFAMEMYCGPKSGPRFEEIAAARDRSYEIVTHPDTAWCTFQSIRTVMEWLLVNIHRVVGNYGVAIIILVIIVRLILHPISKRGQANMAKMQKAMARLKPKQDALAKQYKNDKQKYNEELMKLYREENINPASNILGCLPMAFQMPIWVALWSTLNTNIELRHRPFFGWINDLSAPDALIPLPESWHFSLPLLGPVVAFNLLPVIMAITMYGQQKLTMKLTKPSTPPPPPAPDPDGKPPPIDQLAQQQKIMSFMLVFFGILFYNFPSGLNLYILSSNLLGMLEQYQIKKHIRLEEERAAAGPRRVDAPVRRGPSWLERLQKRAEDARLARGDGRKRR